MCNVPHINRTKVGRMQHVSGCYCTDLHRAACPVFVCAGLFSASHEARRWRRLNETPRKKQRKKTIEKTNGAKKEHILLLHYIIIIIIYIPKIKIGTLETCWDMLIDIYICVCVITVCVCARVIALYRFIRTITVSSFYWSINSIAGTGTSGRRRHQVTEQWHLSLWPSTTGAPMERRFNTNKNLQFSCGSRMGPLGHFDPTWAPHIIIRITPGRP